MTGDMSRLAWLLLATGICRLGIPGTVASYPGSLNIWNKAQGYGNMIHVSSTSCTHTHTHTHTKCNNQLGALHLTYLLANTPSPANTVISSPDRQLPILQSQK